MSACRIVVCAVVVLLLPLSFMLAGSTGKITGIVKDAKTGEPLPGANISVEGTALGTASDFEGNYVILNVPPGKYSLTVSFVGYKRLRVQNVEVAVDFTTRIDLNLEGGSVEIEAVEVRSERTPLIRQDLTNPVASLSQESMAHLPVTDISELIGLQAGVTVDDDGTIHMRGGYGNEIAYTLNGVNINNPYGNNRSIGLASNAVQEVSVSGGTFSAEYGTALSGVVNYVTREGGGKYNGSFKAMTGDHRSSHKDLFFNIDDFTPANVYRIEAALGGPILSDQLAFFTSGVYNYNGGHIYGERLYNTTDSYLSREAFGSGDPRGGASTAPYYFGPMVHDTSNMSGGPTGDRAIVPLNWSRSANFQANLSYRFTSSLKLKYEIVYNRDESPYYSGSRQAYRFKPDGQRIDKSHGLYHSVELTHLFGEKSFYTLKGSLISDKQTINAYDAYNDPRYLPSHYSRVFTNTSYLTGGTDLNRFERNSDAWGVKFDLVSQLFSIHELKVGAEFRQHTVDRQSYTLQFRDIVNGLDPSFTNMLTKGSRYESYIPDVEGGKDSVYLKPIQASAYVQDKIELFKSIILNVGLRYDYFDPAAFYNTDISTEIGTGNILLNQNLKKATPKHMLAPRVSVSYPITDAGTIRFSYGHFYQFGSLSSLYRNYQYRSPRGTPTFGNADVRPQKSVQYELGLQQGLTDDLRLEVTAYYKDVRDYIQTQTIITPRGDLEYDLLTNLAYANTRGVSVSLLKRRAPDDMLSATLDYTFQVAEGNRTEPSEEMFFSQQSGKLAETYLVPMSFDREHTLTSTIMLSEPNDWTVSLLGYVRTGTPYTPSFPTKVVPIIFIQNSDRQVVQWNADLKAEKFFQLLGMTYSVFLQVDNLFDVENENAVYANSGRALYSITPAVEPTLMADTRNRIVRGDPGMIPLSAIDNYYAYPGNISTPRLIRLGFSVSF